MQHATGYLPTAPETWGAAIEVPFISWLFLKVNLKPTNKVLTQNILSVNPFIEPMSMLLLLKGCWG